MCLYADSHSAWMHHWNAQISQLNLIFKWFCWLSRTAYSFIIIIVYISHAKLKGIYNVIRLECGMISKLCHGLSIVNVQYKHFRIIFVVNISLFQDFQA